MKEICYASQEENTRRLSMQTPATGLHTSKGENMHSTHTPNKYNTRRGNLLVGCGIVILILILLVGIGVFFVATSWRGWTASISTDAIDKILTESNIDPAEHAEVMAHIETLMQRFEDKDITVDQLGKVIKNIGESPVIPSAMVMGIDSLYIAESDLEDSEKTQGRIDLARFTQGLFDESIDPDAINDVLAPVTTKTPDDNDIRLNLTIDSTNGRSITALRSADEVTAEDLRELIAIAKAKADEAEVTQTPVPVDLSDAIAKAIGIALGEIEDDSVENIAEEAVEDAAEEPAEETPATDDGP